MSRNYQRSYRAFARGLGVVAVCGLTLSAQAKKHDARYGVGAAQRSPHPADNSKPYLPFPVQNDIKRIASALEAESKKGRSAEERAEAKQNLQDQDKLAFWGRVMAGIAGAETLITLIGVLLVWKTLVASRAAAEAARDSVTESRRAAKAAEDSLAQTKIGTENELRAWIDVEADLHKLSSSAVGTDITVEISLANVGKTPALNVELSFEVRPTSGIVVNGGGLPKPQKYPSAMPSLMPGKVASQRFGKLIKITEIQLCIDQCRKSVVGPEPLMLTVDLIAYYRTIFDKETGDKRMTSIRYNIPSCNLHAGPRG